jgi:HAD superfamily hydrolase (TIGR01509 family)
MRRALIFDCDGVLADTEPNGHLVAFNRMWEELGVPWRWTREQYGEKLKIGGGKERMASLFHDREFLERVKVPADEPMRKALIAHWHKEKTRIYEEIIASGSIAPRPGIERLAHEAHEAGWRLAVASTSAVPAVTAVLNRAVGALANEFSVYAGDIVPAKKPAPDIYAFAVADLGIPARSCVAIEDSRNGLLSAHEAHLPVVITVSEYTAREDFSEALLVVDSLGEPEMPSRVLASRTGRTIGNFVSLEDLEAVVRVWRGPPELPGFNSAQPEST